MWGSVARRLAAGSSAMARGGLVSLALVLATTIGAATARTAEGELPAQLKAAQENALKWWRDPLNQLTTVESTSTDEFGNRLRTIVFILRDPNGRSLAVSRAGSAEMQVFFQQRLDQLLRQAIQQHGLSEPQVDKLKLAAELDVARFNRRVQEAAQSLNQFDQWHANDGEADKLPAQELAAAKSSLASIAQHCERGLFDEQSLYMRVLTTLLEHR